MSEELIANESSKEAESQISRREGFMASVGRYCLSASVRSCPQGSSPLRNTERSVLRSRRRALHRSTIRTAVAPAARADRGNCFGCHIAARPQWDLVCEADHGCAPIPVTRAMVAALQRTDPRCDNPAISAEDAEALKQLAELMKAPK